MKRTLLVLLLMITGAGYAFYHFDLIHHYNFFLSDRNKIPTDTLSKTEIPVSDKTKKTTLKKKRPKKSNPYAQLDQYAFNAPSNKCKTIRSLSEYLSKGSVNEYEKARLIYAWMASHINYDDGSYNTNQYSDMSAESVFKSKKAVCEGYSNLFKILCDSMGLESIKIIGYAKGYGYTIGDKLTETDHAWNAVKINGQWKLIDATWGTGYGETVNGKLKSSKKYDLFWFATDPYAFLFTHLPEHSKDQFIGSIISKSQYERLAYVHNGLFELGIPAKSILEKSLADPSYKAPGAWMSEYDINIITVPLQEKMIAGNEYFFSIKCVENVSFALVNEKEWIYLKKENGFYSGMIKPFQGTLTLSARLNGFEDSYTTLLKYEIK